MLFRSIRTVPDLPGEREPDGYRGSGWTLGENLVDIAPTGPTLYYVTARVYDSRGRLVALLGPQAVGVAP